MQWNVNIVFLLKGTLACKAKLNDFFFEGEEG